MIELCGAKLVPGTIDVAAEPPPERRLELRGERAEGLLGIEIAPDLREEYLRRLDFDVSSADSGLEAVVPAHRDDDVTREVDLIEEVGRVHGYADHLPSTLPEVVGQGGRLTRDQLLRRRAEDVTATRASTLVVTLSVTDPGMPERLRIKADDVRAKPIAVSNPLSRDHSAMRTTLPEFTAGRRPPQPRPRRGPGCVVRIGAGLPGD